jgi:hypothetical protein
MKRLVVYFADRLFEVEILDVRVTIVACVSKNNPQETHNTAHYISASHSRRNTALFSPSEPSGKQEQGPKNALLRVRVSQLNAFRTETQPLPPASIPSISTAYEHSRFVRGNRSRSQLPASTRRTNGDAKQPTDPVGLAVSGMNDVINSQGYTQAFWWYCLPVEAWVLWPLLPFLIVG